MKNLYFNIRKSFVRKLLGFFSISSVLFVFQACYGTPQDMANDVLIEGTVKNKADNSPIPGLKVDVITTSQSTFTDSNGTFSLYAPYNDTFSIKFTDSDGSANGLFKTLDTTTANQTHVLNLNVLIEPSVK